MRGTETNRNGIKRYFLRRSSSTAPRPSSPRAIVEGSGIGVRGYSGETAAKDQWAFYSICH